MYSVKKMIEQSGSDSILFAHKASNLLENGMADEAVQICEDGIKRFPFYAEGHLVLGRCYQSQERLEDARREYERTLFYAPGHIKAIKALAFVHYKNKQRQTGNELLISNALYEPFNAKLVEFLKSEDLYNRIYQIPKSEETRETVPSLPESDSTGTSDQLLKMESAETDTFEFAGPQDAGWREAGTGEASNFELGVEAKPVIQDTSKYAEARVENDDQPLRMPDQFGMGDADLPVPDEDTLQDESLRFGEEPPESISEQFAKTEVSPQEELGMPMLPGEEDNFNDWANRMVIDQFHDQEQFELNNIVENIAESPFTSEKLDLSQFSNLRDDFMTIISHPQQDQDAGKQDEPGEHISYKFGDEAEGQGLSAEANEDNSALEDLPQAGTFGYNSGPLSIPEEQIEENIDSAEDSIDLDQWMTEATRKDIQEVKEAAELFTKKPDEPLLQEHKTQPVQPGDKSDLSRGQILIKEYKVPESAEQAAEETRQGLTIEQILENPNLVTPTFGEILIAQRKFTDAKMVFSELAKRDPQNQRFRRKIEFLDKIITVQK